MRKVRVHEQNCSGDTEILSGYAILSCVWSQVSVSVYQLTTKVISWLLTTDVMACCLLSQQSPVSRSDSHRWNDVGCDGRGFLSGCCSVIWVYNWWDISTIKMAVDQTFTFSAFWWWSITKQTSYVELTGNPLSFLIIWFTTRCP